MQTPIIPIQEAKTTFRELRVWKCSTNLRSRLTTAHYARTETCMVIWKLAGDYIKHLFNVATICFIYAEQ